MVKSQHIAIGAALAAAVALGVAVTAFSNASDDKGQHAAKSGQFGEAETAEIRAIVRDYLLENPEVLIEALQAYQTRERENADRLMIEGARAKLPALLDESGGFALAADPARARVAVIELFDYHCGYCKRATGLVQDLARKDPAVKVFLRDLPILREESELAARAVLAAREQGKASEMHFALMGASGTLTRERIGEIAGKTGVDFSALEKAMKTKKVDAALDSSREIADAMGIDGTPAFIVASFDGAFIEVIPGFSADAILAAVEDAKKGKRK